MKLYPDCGYYNDECDDKYGPEDGECESCYGWKIYTASKKLSGE